MKHSKAVLTAIILSCTGMAGLQAQEAILSTGGDASGSGGSSSYSVGQMVYTTNTGTNGSVAQGVQQPYEISVVIGIKEISDDKLIFRAYPNPANDILQLEIRGIELNDLCYHLYNSDGKLIQNRNIQSDNFTISMKKLAPATYYLKLTDNGRQIKTLKIVKN